MHTIKQISTCIYAPKLEHGSEIIYKAVCFPKYYTQKNKCVIIREKGKCMVAVKQEAQEMIQNLPDNCTYEDIQYHLYVVEKIKNGINRAENGEVSSHQDAKERMAKWLSN